MCHVCYQCTYHISSLTPQSCRNVLDLDGMTCIAACPVEAYADTNSTCQPCADSCIQFTENQYIVSISEDTDVSTAIAMVETTDQRQTDRPVQFVITSGDPMRQFAVNPATGIITLAASLDRERQNSHTLTVMAFDVGTSPVSTQSASATVLVLVGDVNDNPPTLSQERYSTSITENSPAGTRVLLITATDADTPPNAMMTFTLAPGVDSRPFQLNSTTGELTTTAPLDFEQRQAYLLVVMATDSGSPPLNSSAEVTVTVVDENDVRPIFQQTRYSVSLSELTPAGSTVLQLQANDTDTSDPMYELTASNLNNAFQIDSLSGFITTVTNLDYESISDYSLTVVARDGVPNPLPSGTATILIAITDENDNAPAFSRSEFTATVPEGEPPFTLILNISAVDLDSGNNSIVDYTITMGNTETFSVDRTGALFALVSLDREERSTYVLVVRATDRGSPPLFSNAAVIVIVSDINDNAPQFNETRISANLTESHPTGTVIAMFRATDVDLGNNAAVSFQLDNTTEVPFTIDSTTGEVSLTQPLDYETVMDYEIPVVARDGGTISLFSEALLVVSVVDINDNPPVFSQQLYFMAIPENFTVGLSVLQVVTMDQDTGTNAAVTYQIVAGDPTNFFTIDTNTGVIMLESSVDFERQAQYILTISATNSRADPPLASTTTVRINITELNEHFPMFSQAMYQASLVENEPSGTSVVQVVATDLDDGSSGEISFEIAAGNTGSAFEITDTGVVLTRRPLDREQEEVYMLTVVGTDRGTPPLSSTTIVMVTVLDVNDSPPQFTFTVPYAATLAENAPQGTAVTTTPPLDASDADSIGPNSTITFSITGGDPGGFFTIDPLTGQLGSERSADFEMVNRFVLAITATDSGVPPLSSNATVVVSISDQNDNPPMLTGLAPLVVFTEGQGQLILVSNISITDADSLPLRLITVTLSGPDVQVGQVGTLSVSPPPPSVVVRSENSGQLLELSGSFTPEEATVVLRTLTFANGDSEPDPASRFVTISLSDGTFSSTARVEVDIELVNDNPPRIDLDTASPGVGYTTVFTEGGPAVALTGSVVSLTDADSGATELVSLSVELTNARDGASEKLSVRGSGGLQVQFGPNNHSATITAPESATFAVFESLLATLTYVNAADEPQLPLQRTVQVIASDGTLESDPVTSNVTILLINDPPRLRLGRNVDHQVEFVEGEGPVLLTSPLNFVLSDSDNTELQNASISLLNAPDSGQEVLVIGGIFANLTITATNHSIVAQGPGLVSEFASLLQAISYNNVLASPSADQRRVEFTISDGAAIAMATTFVTFNLVNDPPLLDLNGLQEGNDFMTVFYEGSSPVPITSQLVLQDVDSSSLHFATIQLSPILDGTLEGLTYNTSQMDSSSINVTISRGLVEIRGVAPLSSYAAVLQDVHYFNNADEPTVAQRMVELTVSDGETNSSAVATIMVLPVNDIPEFLLSGGEVYTVNYVEESSAVGVVEQQRIVLRDNDNTTLAFLRVTMSNVYDGVAEILGFQDPSPDQSLVDTLENNRVLQQQVHTLQFSPASSTLDNFRQLISSLSYRHAGLEPTAGVRVFQMVVSDGVDLTPPQQSTVNVTLLNDNVPSFQQSLVQASVPENTMDITVATVAAMDQDSNMGPFALQGTVQYSIISGNDEGFFAIGLESGVITLVRPKDREVSTAGAVLTVQATNPVPLDDPRAAYPTSFVIVSILDQNDNAPVFSDEPYQFQVAENATVGHLLGTILATDTDAGSNADITFEISQGDLTSLFLINRVTGVLMVAGGLDRETAASYSLSITASDRGRPALSNTTTVSIEILDINDNPPVFSAPSYATSTSEFTPIGASLLTVVASDADAGPNGQISYQLVDTSVFIINETTGVVSTAASLDREVQPTYTFTVVTTDGGLPQLSSTVQATVNVLDENDNPPLFGDAAYSVAVSESVPVGQLVLTVVASDNDSGSNGLIFFSLNDSVPFTIDSSSGTITVSELLDREVADFYQFEVTATDRGSRPLQSVVPVHVTILDSNDNPPMFSQRRYETQLEENVPLFQSVFTVSATDIDEGSNGRVMYSLSSVQGRFQINGSTGEVTTRDHIDRESQGLYQLEVIATDQGSPPLISMATLTINITDLNDNSPVFSNTEHQFNTAENSPPATIGTILANDPDLGINAEISYSLVNASLPFTINESTGVLSTLQPLDREQAASYNFTILATDRGQPPNSASATILVTIEDRNDIVPQFTRPSYSATVPESLPTGSTLLLVTAVDNDEGSNAEVSYQLLSSSGIFALNSVSGEIQLSGSLDAETRDSYLLTVQARDNGFPPLSSTATVAVTVTDVNDNPIQLTSAPTTAVFVEEDPPVSIATNITVQDSDITSLVQNATVELLTVQQCCEDQLSLGITDPKVSFQLLNNNQFLVIEGPTNISTMSAILQSVQYQNTNPEPQGGLVSAQFTVFDGFFISMATITITVQTINDHAPIVSLGRENVPNTTVIFVENTTDVPIARQAVITDDDSDALTLASVIVTLQTPLDGAQEFLTAAPRGLVSVFPPSGGPTIQLSGPASIENFTAVLSSVQYRNSADNPRSPLERIIEVIANDGALDSPPSYVTVTIIPVNDPPILRLSDFNATFVEGGPPVALTSTGLQLTDPDSESLSTASIMLLGTLDPGNEVLLFERTVSPVFSRTSLTQLQLSGPASLAAFTSALQSVSYLNNATNPTPGTRVVQFTVSDGSLSATAAAGVLVRTTNDPPHLDLNGPQAGVNHTTQFVEGSGPIRLVPAAAVIEDPDNTRLASLSIRLLSPADGTREFLSASSSGSITATYDMSSSTLLLSGSASILDYHTALLNVSYQNTADEPSGEQRRLEIVASDGEASSDPATVLISFIFVNDPPVVVLDSGGDFVTIYTENSPPVAIVNPRSANVMDVDTPTLTYLSVQLSNLLDGDLERLNYSDTTGGLIVEAQFNTSSQTASYNFTYASEMPLRIYSTLLLSLTYHNLALEPNAATSRVITISVSDGELRSSPVTSTVSILLVDDNQPQFEQSFYNFSTAEDTSLGSIVGVVSAMDADLGDTFLYQLSSEGAPFSINGTSGVITVQGSLDRESQPLFTLTAQLSRDTPPFSLFDNEATVLVTLMDVNDNPPVFNQTSFSIEVTENVPVGTTVGVFTAQDEDEGSNGALQFSLSSSDFFNVDPSSGALVVRSQLDREMVASIQFVVMVMDEGNPPLSSQASVVVNVLDANESPQFSQPSYFTQLVETTPPGTSVLQLSASDGDLGSNAQLTFTLTPTVSEFTVNSSTGVITISSTLTPSVYNFTAMVTDHGQPPLSSQAAVTIQVVSINSTLPVFTQPSYEGDIVENSATSISILTAAAFDPITNESVRYSLVPETFEFYIDPVTGVLSSNASFDRESRDVYQLQLCATSADGTRVGFSQAVIRVLDANDFVPLFSQTSYSFTAVENERPGAIVGAVLALDSMDLGSNAVVVSYSISDFNFSISSVGIITTSSQLDREAQDRITMTVFATDGGSPPLTGSSTVVVSVLDQNDNAPEFSRAVYEGAVAEGQPAGSSVVTVVTSDRDEGSNAEVTFTVNSTVFTVDPQTGVVSTLQTLDFEQTVSYQVIVLAMDHGTTPLSSTAMVTVRVLDIDDTPPQFVMPVFVGRVFEEQDPITVVNVIAFDIDSGPGNPIMYSITAGNEGSQFSVSFAGNISTLVPLDRETASQYTLTVEASNLDEFGSTLSSTATVMVDIIDINDHPPAFLGIPYVFTVTENATGGTLLGSIVATDADEGSNANISAFRIISGPSADLFDLNPVSGTLQLSNSTLLNRETQDVYTLMVEVADGGTPPLFSNTTVTIVVTDINDQAPVFTQEVYNITVREDVPAGSVIFTANASDADLGTNADITFTLSEPSSQFSINSTTGNLFLSSSLDFETLRRHTITLLAVDGGTPHLTGSATLTIAVQDVDDMPVVFEPDMFSASVFENSPLGTTLTAVIAQDPDTVGNLITYTIAPRPLVPFSVDPQSGDVTVAGELDRESVSRYTFSVFASNRPGMSATAMVTVQITDVNDVLPSFPGSPFQFQISELAPVGTVLGQVTAVDSDMGLAGTIVEYRLENPPMEFDIDPTTGVLNLTGTLDFEMVERYVINVTAMDGGSPSLRNSTEVLLNILDFNDNAPQFVAENFTTSVSENAAVGSGVFVAMATDADSSSNGEILYSLSPRGTPFAIDPFDGTINITAPLSLQTYFLQLVATDRGRPPLTSTATLLVRVTDASEPPSFTEPSYSLELSENTATGSVVLRVLALDPDTGSNAEISYSIQPETAFTISPDSGNITLIQSLDFEQMTSITHTLVATDTGNPQLSAIATLLVTVLDENDNAPVFSQPNYLVSIPEDTPQNTVLLFVNATDADSSSNAEVTYVLVAGSHTGLFAVDALSGSISPLQSLDHESLAQAELTVLARDGGQPVMSSSAIVTILITDVDDNPPVFEQLFYSANVSEDASIGSALLTLQANDSDSGSNAAVEYRLANTSVPFNINATTGELTVASQGLDRETIADYVLVVEAFNPFSPIFTATVTVQVLVLDSNDNPPQFDSTSLMFTISESAPVGTSVGTLIATDNDTGINAAVRYSIEPASEYVVVDSNTGKLMVARSIDFESTPVVQLTAVVRDGGNPPLSTAATLRVILEDANDEQPVINISRSQFTFREESAPTGIGSGVSVSDPDTFPLVSASVKLFSGAGMAEPPATDFIQLDRAFSESQGLSLSASPHCINLTGNVSTETYTMVLSRLQFGSTAAEPMGGQRRAQLDVFDGRFSSNIDSIYITVELINDNPPVLDLSVSSEGLGFQTVFTEGGVFVFIVAQDASLADADGDDIQSVNINITNPLDGSLEQLSAFPFGRITVERNASGITLLGPAPAADFELVLKTVGYEDLADEPLDVQTARIIEFVVSDGLFSSQIVSTTVIIQPVNDPPVLRLGATQDVVLVYSETVQSLPLLSDNFVLSDPDSDLISFVNVTVVGFQPGVDRFNYSAEGTNVTVEFLSGTLLLTGLASIPEFVSVLQTLSYINTYVETDQFDQLVGGRVIEFTANDGSLSSPSVSAFITFSAVNDPPMLDLNGPAPGTGFTTTFEEGNANVFVVSSQLIVTDVDSQFLQSAIAQLRGILDQSSETLFTTDVTAGITVTFDPTTATLTLSGSATAGSYQTILRSLVYRNTAIEPTPGTRSVTIAVSDGEATSSVATSLISVANVNDPPILSLTPANLPFVENGPPVTLTSSSSITDSDNQLLASLGVTIQNATDGSLEVVNSSVGLGIPSEPSPGTLVYTFSLTPPGTIAQYVTLLSSLTYTNMAAEPTNTTRTISITVSDGIDSSVAATLSLPVMLLNDNPPVFSRSVVQLELSENTASSTSVFQAVATDEDMDSVLTYSLANTSDMFDVGGSDGEVRLVGSLDRESQQEFTLIIQVTDGLNIAQMQLDIRVLDENDNAPAFSLSLYTATVIENSPVGVTVIQVVAMDIDEGSNAEVSYSIREGNSGEAFHINESTGLIQVAGRIDFEATSSYRLVVVAQDGGIPTMSSTSFVVITVTNLNDNPPTFSPNMATVPWPEDSPRGTTLYTAQAIDLDTDNRITYSFMNDSDTFAIAQTTGVVSLIGALDREQVDTYTLTILAFDGVSTGALQLTIMVTDIDDNPPMFQQDSFFISIPENTSIGDTLVMFQVSDPDEGTNADIQLQIISGDPSSRFEVTGQLLILAGGLDRELQSSYNITIVARNPNSPLHNALAVVRIEVSDVNDSPPQFGEALYVFSLPENASVGTTVGTVTATDADIGSNAVVTYSIASGDPEGKFTVSSEGNVIVTQLLDRENTSQYALTILAQDGSSPRHSATTCVVINISDINDNPPEFVQPMVSVSLLEDSPPGRSLITLVANDNDVAINAQVVYSVHTDNASSFAIGSESGILTTRVMFDFETSPSLMLVIVLATDGGSPRLSSEAQVTVTLTDLNEFAPQFEASQFTVNLSEDVPAITTIINITATDLDGGVAGIVEYTLLNQLGPFAINNTTGNIYTTSELDRETTPSYQLMVQASNQLVVPPLPSTAIITVLLLDVNDNPPRFAQENFTAAVTIGTEVGTPLVTVSARDPDIGTNSEIRYLLSGISRYFTISETNGTIVLASSINFTNTFILTVTATDQGVPPLSSVAMVTITVVQPVQIQFTQDGAGFILSGGTSTSHQFGLFADMPAGSNGRISAALGGVEVEAGYSSALPQAMGVRGVVLEEEVWHDQPDVRVVVQVSPW